MPTYVYSSIPVDVSDTPYTDVLIQAQVHPVLLDYCHTMDEVMI